MIRVYAEDKETGKSILEEKDAKLMNGVYLHGDLQKLNGYDLVDRYIDDEDICKNDGVFFVTVVLPDGTEHKALAYLWKSPCKYKLCKTFVGEFIPTCVEGERQHGLICTIDDVENEDALKKFNERAWHV